MTSSQKTKPITSQLREVIEKPWAVLHRRFKPRANQFKLHVYWQNNTLTMSHVHIQLFPAYQIFLLFKSTQQHANF